VVAPDAHKQIEPWLVGGTGSSSHSLEQPTFLPDKFESGTPNTLGILSLGVSVPQLQEQGIDGLRKREQTLTQRFIDGAQSLPLRVHGTQNAAQSAALVSVSSPAHDSGVLARDLYDTHGIITRSGLHCSPLAHRTAGTFPEGTVRFSFGWESTEEEIDTALAALEQLLAKPQQA
jgi:selenocysteine lyase/cysteine desulfurase